MLYIYYTSRCQPHNRYQLPGHSCGGDFSLLASRDSSFMPDLAQSSSPLSISSNPLTLSSLIFNIVNRCLLFTFFTLLCRLFVFSLVRKGSLSTPMTTARHTKNRSSKYFTLPFAWFITKCAVGACELSLVAPAPVRLALGCGTGITWLVLLIEPVVGSSTTVVVAVGLLLFGSFAAALSVKSRDPRFEARLRRMVSPGCTPCIKKGRRRVSPSVRRYGRS